MLAFASELGGLPSTRLVMSRRMFSVLRCPQEEWLVLGVHRNTSFLPFSCSSHDRLFFGADSLIFSLESMLVLVFLIQFDSTNASCLVKSGWHWPCACVRLGESPAQVLCSPGLEMISRHFSTTWVFVSLSVPLSHSAPH